MQYVQADLRFVVTVAIFTRLSMKDLQQAGIQKYCVDIFRARTVSRRWNMSEPRVICIREISMFTRSLCAEKLICFSLSPPCPAPKDKTECKRCQLSQSRRHRKAWRSTHTIIMTVGDSLWPSSSSSAYLFQVLCCCSYITFTVNTQ